MERGAIDTVAERLAERAGVPYQAHRRGHFADSVQLRHLRRGLLSETNALNGVTTYARGTSASGQTVLTNTYPDGGIRIETLYQDGSLLSVTGSAVHPVQYLYGVDGDGAFTTEIKVTETGGTNEWVKTSDRLEFQRSRSFSPLTPPSPH